MKRQRRIDLVFRTIMDQRNKQGVTAHELAGQLGLSRANVSHDLNRLWKEGKIGKTAGRPVRFHAPEERKNGESPATVLDKLGREFQSLTTPIEQAKAAILYPPKGMHTLILGETGVGKTAFAGLMHTYAVETGKMRHDAPFVTFNCADYANNPQLLIGQLFGVKKGAYTGADADRVGLIEKAEGGILFLDEVHRLPAEGQEMFFTFMDKGTYRRLGETEERTAHVLIISSTTENPESVLLKTFLRRIPMIIKLPSLRERGLKERFQLIVQFFREESYRLGKEIHVSANSMRALLVYPCPNNIGQLKTDIQLVCAKAYADYITCSKEQLEITSRELPAHVKEGLLKAKEHRLTLEELVGSHQQFFVFRPDQEKFFFEKESVPDGSSLYEDIEKLVKELRARGVSDEEVEIDIENYFSRYIRGVNRQMRKTNLSKIIDPQIMKLVEEIIAFAQGKLQRRLSPKVFHSLALHIQTLLERVRHGKQIVNPHLNKMRGKYKTEFGLALECVRMIEEAFQVDLPIDEAGFLTMFFILEDLEADEETDTVSVLVIAHGNGTATAMVEVTNRLLDVHYAQAIDLPLEMEPQEALEKAKEVAGRASRKAGMILLVDMGSLLTFGELIEKELGVPVKVVPLVSTLHVIEATRKAMLGHSLDEIYRDVRLVSTFDSTETTSRQANRQTDKAVILTACMTGEGSALALKNMLQHHLRYDEALCEIVPLNIVGREELKERIQKWKKERNVLCVVSSFPIDRDIPTFSIEEVLNLQALPEIQKKIDIAETYHRMGEVLDGHLQRVSGVELLADVRSILAHLQRILNLPIPDEDLIGISLHLCCMVDRLLGGEIRVAHPNSTERLAANPQLARQIKLGLQPLEQKYGIEVTPDEICFLMNFFEENKTLLA
ncbi:sigma 54-interacting transcriptional regulator [Brevibacillus sp. SYP-B805]|uniref:sigma 54-interacting transcriptional regulator n=1 Tax=Brevibacillus sp. SYP-B805 TaxID=1578199 RepID=UPI0013EC44FA|nr:sigma-54-dependent transcriptional regulator [Brevibacillus sp. SYP-B805]NGQ97343.1 sigma 54-interacting transcriptional regulator [Brevibacillus sp. SYP-B805]